MTTNPSHAAPWTFRRIVSMLTGAPNPRRRANRPGVTRLLSGREATARQLFGEQVRWAPAQMLDYDASPMLQGAWLAEADRQIEAYRKQFFAEKKLIQSKRFTDAELAAEYWEHRYDNEVCSGWASDYNIIKQSRERLDVIGRFATLPHYDEADQ